MADDTTTATATTTAPAETAAEAAADTGAAKGGRRLAGLALKLPVKLPLKLPLKLPAMSPLKLPASLPGALTALRPRRLDWRQLPRPGRLPLGDLMLALGAASLALSVLWVVTGPSRERILDQGRAARTVANAATLQLAAETYAAANRGQYPRDARALLSWLPEGRAPRNPYTGEGCLFRAGPGEVTWQRLPGTGYVIEAWGPGAGGPCRLASFHSGSAVPLP
jgi:hypothetical protein